MNRHVTADPSVRQLQAEVAALQRENEKLRTVRDALIRQVDRNNDLSGRAFNLVKPIIEVEGNVEKRIQRLARAMSEAKIARRQLRQAIDSIGEGFILYDQDDRIVLCNRKYRQIFPELEHLLKPGTHFRQIIEHAARIGVIVESVTDPDAWIASRIASHAQKQCQFQQLLGDGRWIQISEQATEDGGKVTIVSDITPFKRLEEARRLSKIAEQSSVLATTVASIAQGVIVFDKDLNLVAWNSQAAMLLNLPYVDMHSGVNVRTLLRLIWRHGAQMPISRRRDARSWILNVERRPPLRLEISYPGGRYISANFRGMPDDGFVVTLTDVTAQVNAARLLERSKEELEARVGERTRELTRLNVTLQDEIRRHEETAADLDRTRKAAEAANLSKTHFLAAASHDLLQPLNAARLYIFALESSPLIEAGAHELLDNISQALQSTEAILSTLLEISKMDAGAYTPKHSAIDVAQLFARLQIEFEPLARQRGLMLKVMPTAARVWTDENLLRRIVQNFLSNAVKYTESGRILLGVRRQGSAVRIEVHDTGPGIATENRELVFQEFKRATSPTNHESGLGLGLAIVRRAAGILGHPIALESREGKGSCFSVTVPVSGGMKRQEKLEDGQLETETAIAVSAAARGDGRDPILILENDESVAHAMATLFQHWQLNSIIAASHGEAIDALSAQAARPQAVIADLHLDGALDGIAAIRELRSSFGAGLPGILITAEQTTAIREQAQAERIEYFSKPLKPAQLRAYLNHLLAEAVRDMEPSA